jgi:hypothetical protein
MRKELFILTVIIILSITSCRKTTHETHDFPVKINLNLSEAIADSMNLSEIARNIEYIPLQTTDSALLGRFLYFTITRKNFFIKDGLRVLTFDKNGRFVNSLFRVGSGPGEANADYIAVDEAGQKVFVFDQRIRRTKVYDFSGTFIKVINKPIMPPEYLSYSIGFFNNNLLVQTIQRRNVKYLYSCFDLRNDSIRILYKNYKSYNKETEGKIQLSPYDYHYQITDSTILFKETYCDTIFSVDKNFVRSPRYIITLGKEKLDWETWCKSAFNIAGGPPNGYIVQSFAESKTYLVMVLQSYKKPQIIAFYNKQNKTTKIYKNKDLEHPFNQVYLKNDLDRLMPFTLINKNGYLSYYDGCLYSLIEANIFSGTYLSASESLKSSSQYLKRMSPVFSQINEFSNPIIIKVTLK